MKKFTALLLVATLCFGAVGCSRPVTEQKEQYLFTDSCGREVTLPKSISKIAASGSLAQIILFAIAPEMLVGLASRFTESDRGIIPDSYFELPYLGKLYASADLNIEALAAAGPELIIDIGEPKDSSTEDLDALQLQTNIPTVFISATLETMPETFRTLGTLLGKEKKGEELAAFCERVYARTCSIVEEVGNDKVNALIVGGEDGLSVLAKGSYHAELMDMLTNNLAVVDNPSSKGMGNAVDMEQLLLWNPDFILFMPDSIYTDVNGQKNKQELDTIENDHKNSHELDAMKNEQKNSQKLDAMEKGQKTWQELDAIANGNYVEVPYGPHNWMGMPPSVQRYLGMLWLTYVLYPEYCDYDIKEEITEYYRLFYSCELTDAQYESLTQHAFY